MTQHMLASLVMLITLQSLAAAENNQVLELRTYTLVDSDAEAKLDAYLEQALIPALKRQGLGPIGAFDQAGQVEEGTIEVMLLVSGPSADMVTAATAKLAADGEYRRAAAEYLKTPAKQPLIKRIRSELLMSFNCWPRVTIPPQTTAGKSRLFELPSTKA